jgi:hypothetical protein
LKQPSSPLSYYISIVIVDSIAPLTPFIYCSASGRPRTAKNSQQKANMMFSWSAKIASLFFWLTILKQHSTTTASTTKTKTSTMAPTVSSKGECATSLDLLGDLRKKYPHQPTFLQAVEEMALSLQSLFTDPEEGEFYQRAFLAMTEPERAISFRVPWEDDAGVMHFNRGWRVEFSRYVIVPYCNNTNTIDSEHVYIGSYDSSYRHLFYL